MNVNFFIFLLTINYSSSFSERIIYPESSFKIKSKLPENYQICHKQLISKFFKINQLSETFLSKDSDSESLQICPGLDITCCDTMSLSKQFSYFKQSNLALRNLFLIHEEISNGMKKQGIKTFLFPRIIPIFIQDDISDIDEPSLLSDFLKEWQIIQNNNIEITNIIPHYYSKILCSICHPQTFLKLYRPSINKIPRDENMYLFLDIQTNNKFIEMMVKWLEFVQSLARIYQKFKLLTEINKFSSTITFEEIIQYQIKIDDLKKCKVFLFLKTESEKMPKFCQFLYQNPTELTLGIDKISVVSEFYAHVSKFMMFRFRGFEFKPREQVTFPTRFMFNLENEKIEHKWSQITVIFDVNLPVVFDLKYNEELWVLKKANFNSISLIFVTLILIL